MSKKSQLTNNDTETSEENSLPILYDHEVEVLHQNERFAQMLQTVRDYITENEWNCKERLRDDGVISFMMNFNMDNGPQRVYLQVKGSGEQFMVHAYPHFSVQEEYRVAVAIFLTYFNRQMIATHLEIDMKDGELCMSCSSFVEGSFLSREMIDFLHVGAMMLLDGCLPFIMSIIYGNASPEKAFKEYCKQS